MLTVEGDCSRCGIERLIAQRSYRIDPDFGEARLPVHWRAFEATSHGGDERCPDDIDWII